MGNKDTLCIYAFNSPNVNFTDNQFRMCCHTQPVAITEEIIQFHGTKLFSQLDPLVRIKKDLLSGVQSPACRYCWDTEAAGGKSARQSRDIFVDYVKTMNWFDTKDSALINHRLDNLTDDEIEYMALCINKPTILEIALTNTCDMKCMYCNRHFSTQWESELIKYGEFIKPVNPNKDVLSKKYQDIFWQYFLNDGFKSLDYISFIGGEPLIIDQFYTTLDTILEKYNTYDKQHELPPKVVINIITNLNCKEKYFRKLLDIIPEIHKNSRLVLRIGVSIESIGARAEFIRTGTVWERINSNLERLLDTLSQSDQATNKVEVGLHTSVNSLSVSDMPNFLNYVINLRRKYNKHIMLIHNQVVYPEWLNPKILPHAYEAYITESIDILEKSNLIDPSEFKSINWKEYVKFLHGLRIVILNKDKHIRNIKEFTAQLDKLTSRRSLDFAATFPEMVPFYNSVKDK